MITLLKILGVIVIYILIGVIVLFISKAVDVIQNNNSKYWQPTDDDTAYVAFWPAIVILTIGIGIPYVIYKALYKGIEKIFIAAVETIRAIHKVKEESND